MSEFLINWGDPILLLVIAFGVYFKSYFTKKGENLATKQDISNITEKIENIKHQFSIDLEKNRTLMQKDIHHDNLLLNERTKRILEFYDSVIIFRNEDIGFNPWDRFSDDWEATFRENSEKIYSDYHDIFRKFHLAMVFLQNYPKLFEASRITMEETIRVFKVYKKEHVRVRLAFLNEHNSFVKTDPEKEIEEKLENSYTAAKNSDDVSRAFWKKIELEQYNNAISQFTLELSLLFSSSNSDKL